MRFLKEFSYPDVFQRRVLFYNSFSTFFVLSFVYCHISLVLKYYSLYEPVLQSVAIAGLAGLFLGNISGKLLFKKLTLFRPVLVASDLFFAAGVAAYVLKGLFPDRGDEAFLIFFFNLRPLFYLFTLVLGFLAGVKANYFLKISCGEFIDEKRAILTYVSLILIGLFTGVVMGAVSYLFPPGLYISLFPLIIIVSSAFLVKLPYSPAPLYAQDTKERHEPESPPPESSRRDDLVFTYINFAYITIYIFLGYQTIIKFFGGIEHIKVSFLLIGIAVFFIGFSAAKAFKPAFWFIYSEMLYPVFFMIFLVLINYYAARIDFYTGIMLFIPALLIFGFAFHHTLLNIFIEFDHEKRFTIVDLSLFILPVPVIVALSKLNFTHFWFFVLLYSMTVLNIVFPGIHLLQRKVRGYKKGLFFIFSLLFIPLIIFAHLYFRIPVNRDLYIRHTAGFSGLLDVNQDADFRKHDSLVYLNNSLIFESSDSSLKNLQRSLTPVLLYAREPEGKTGDVLFLYGGQKYFFNPVLSYFDKAQCIDYIPPRLNDFNQLPFTGKSFYFITQASIMSHLLGSRHRYRSIVDIPNHYDQRYNLFRYSSRYYTTVKRSLGPAGFFAQVHNLSRSRPDFLYQSCRNFKTSFGTTIGYLFSDHLVLFGSDDPRALQLLQGSMDSYKKLFREKPLLQLLYYDDVQLAAHLFFTNIDDFIPHVKSDRVGPLYFLEKPRRFELDEGHKNSYIGGNLKILDTIDPSPASYGFKNMMMIELLSASPVITLLKQAGLQETQHHYEGETDTLFQLRRHAEYNSDLRAYIVRVLSFKEEYYLATAIRFEKNKQWEDARQLYKAILKINPDNFDANYRMGILSITLQDLEGAFQHLQRAMQLRKEDGKVLFQMGVMLFSAGRTQEALGYFERSLALNENTASVNHYLGMCYEMLGRTGEAKAFYEKASLLDPNDREIQSSIEKLNRTMEEEKNRWKSPDRKNQSDVEQGESFPLPINKSAQEIRLKDEEE